MPQASATKKTKTITQKKLPTAQLKKCYRMMLLLRRTEEKIAQLYGMQKIRGFCHLYIGQEAIAVALYAAIKSGDTVITSYRCHGMLVASGIDCKAIIAELLGKSIGCSLGKGGSMHMFNKDNGFYGGHGIVGAQVPMGTGIALKHKYKKTNNVSVTVMGDGAFNQGQVYESFNMASTMKLPVVYIIENNEYAMGTAVKRVTANSEMMHKRGEPFGIPGYTANGMDFFDTYDKIKTAVDFCRKNVTPVLLELKTYRYKGHSMSDPATYRSKKEVDSYKENRDPIANMQSYLTKNKIVTPKQSEKIDLDIRKELNKAISQAEEAPDAIAEDIYEHIYATN